MSEQEPVGEARPGDATDRIHAERAEVDLYVPRDAIVDHAAGRLRVDLDRRAAYDAWHRPLKRAPHE